MKTRTARALVAVAATTALAMTTAGGAQAQSPRLHTAPDGSATGVPPYTPTVTYLLRQLTVDEKLLLVHGSIGEGIVTPSTPADPGANGAIGVVAGIARLGIPTFRHVDSNGINMFADSTAYPGRLGVAASFDRSAVSSFGQAVGREGRALGADLIYAPQVDLTRLPTWARNLTTYGEDPYLTSQLATADVEGIQSSGLLAQLKHFAFYNGQDQNTPSIVDERAAHELYLSAYEAALTDGAASSVMCSYATYQISGVQASPDYACENPFGMRQVLRDEFGFTGWIGSDYGASHATSDLLGGLDQEFLSTNLAPAALKPLVDPASPTFDPAYARALDNAVALILYQYQRFGRLDDSSYPGWARTRVPPARPPGPLDRAAGIDLARNLADESAVLLKNEGTALPLRTGAGSSIAVIGPTADLLPAAPGTERSRGFGQRNTITPLDVLRGKAAGATVTYAPGIDRIGTVVPADALTTAPGGPAGLTRTTLDPSGAVVGTQVDAQLAGDQTDLVKGNTYTWTGYLTIPDADTYTLWLQRPTGTVVGNPTGPNAGVNPGYQAGPFTGVFDSASMSVDGTAATLRPVSTLHPNDYPGGPTRNGQYLGLNVVGTALALSAGSHSIKITYATTAKAATPPTMALTWAAKSKDLSAAKAAAAHADTAVVFVDDADTVTAPGNVGTLGPDQDALVDQIASVNPNTVVVLNTGDAVRMPWLNAVRAVLEMWFPGQEGGTATADLLLGLANPAGRLPITFPVDNASTPFAGHPERTVGAGATITWSEGLQMGYRWYLANHVAALFPFGFGLSYTTFAYSHLRVRNVPKGRGGITITFRIRNTGRVTGSEVPQLYVNLPASANEPAVRLANFDRVTLRPGQSTTVRMVLDPGSTQRPLSIWDTGTHDWRIPTGSYGVIVGSSVADPRLTASFTVE